MKGMAGGTVIAFIMGASWTVHRAVAVTAVALVAIVAAAAVLTARFLVAFGPDCTSYFGEDWGCRAAFAVTWRFAGTIAGVWITTIGLAALVASVLKRLYRHVHHQRLA